MIRTPAGIALSTFVLFAAPAMAAGAPQVSPESLAMAMQGALHDCQALDLQVRVSAADQVQEMQQRLVKAEADNKHLTDAEDAQKTETDKQVKELQAQVVQLTEENKKLAAEKLRSDPPKP